MKDIKRIFIPARKCRGALTAEAAIVLPIFLSVLLTITFFIRTVRTYEIVQHAITQAAQEMSSSSYLLEVSGLMDIHDTARDGMKSSADVFRDHMGTVFDTLEDLRQFGGAPTENNPGEDSIEESVKDAESVIEDFKAVTGAAGEMSQDPGRELKGIASMLVLGSFEDIKTEVLIPVARLYMKKYLAGTQSSADARLKGLGIKGGFSGLNLDSSSFFEDDSDNIEIVVRYTLELSIPFRFFSDPVIEQRAVARAWLEGDEPQAGKVVSNETDIWSLNNFQRGKAVRKLLNANLPDTFPIISKFESGTATLIKSMDLTAKSYQEPSKTKEALFEYVDRIAGYMGQEEPWGSRGIAIPATEIKKRELVLVIPENPLDSAVEQAVRESMAYAASTGVNMRIVRYGTKKADTPADSGE